MITHDDPVYLRISRNDLPEITGETPDPIAPAVLCEGADVGLVACGVMASKALLAADELARHGVSARMINVPYFKPFPDEAMAALLTGVRVIVACEEHSVIGGLSQALCWALRGDGRHTDAVAVQDAFGQSAYTHEELLTYYHLNVADIVNKAQKLMKA